MKKNIVDITLPAQEEGVVGTRKFCVVDIADGQDVVPSSYAPTTGVITGIKLTQGVQVLLQLTNDDGDTISEASYTPGESVGFPEEIDGFKITTTGEVDEAV